MGCLFTRLNGSVYDLQAWMRTGAKLRLSPQLAFATNLGPDGHLFVWGGSRRDLAALDAALNTWVESVKKSLCCFNTRFQQSIALNLRSCTHPTLLKLKWCCLLTLSSHKHVLFASYLIHKLDGLYCHQNLDYSSLGVCSFKQNVNIFFLQSSSLLLFPSANKCRTLWRSFIILSCLGEEGFLSRACKVFVSFKNVAKCLGWIL